VLLRLITQPTQDLSFLFIHETSRTEYNITAVSILLTWEDVDCHLPLRPDHILGTEYSLYIHPVSTPVAIHDQLGMQIKESYLLVKASIKKTHTQ